MCTARCSLGALSCRGCSGCLRVPWRTHPTFCARCCLVRVRAAYPNSWWRNRFATHHLSLKLQADVRELRRRKTAEEVKRRMAAATTLQCFVRFKLARCARRFRSTWNSLPAPTHGACFQCVAAAMLMFGCAGATMWLVVSLLQGDCPQAGGCHVLGVCGCGLQATLLSQHYHGWHLGECVCSCVNPGWRHV
jgi:hypothetical protein